MHFEQNVTYRSYSQHHTSFSCCRWTTRCCASHPMCCKHRWMLSVINWWRSSVKLSWQHLQWALAENWLGPQFTLFFGGTHINSFTTRMWANAQRDGRPAEYRWCPLFNATKFGWCPLLECCAVTLPRRQPRWNLQGCPKLTKWSQPLVGRSSPYYQNM